MKDFSLTVINSIDQLTDDQISVINLFLKDKSQNSFSAAYINSLRSNEFAQEVKSNDDFIYRGKFLPFFNKNKCFNDVNARYAISLCSCTSEYTRVSALLLTDKFEPVKVCLSFVNLEPDLHTIKFIQ